MYTHLQSVGYIIVCSVIIALLTPISFVSQHSNTAGIAVPQRAHAQTETLNADFEMVGCFGLTCKFVTQSTPTDSIDSYEWSFEGNAGTGAIETFEFQSTGDKDVSLTVTDVDTGATSTVNKQVNISGTSTVGGINVGESSGCPIDIGVPGPVDGCDVVSGALLLDRCTFNFFQKFLSIINNFFNQFTNKLTGSEVPTSDDNVQAQTQSANRKEQCLDGIAKKGVDAIINDMKQSALDFVQGKVNNLQKKFVDNLDKHLRDTAEKAFLNYVKRQHPDAFQSACAAFKNPQYGIMLSVEREYGNQYPGAASIYRQNNPELPDSFGSMGCSLQRENIDVQKFVGENNFLEGGWEGVQKLAADPASNPRSVAQQASQEIVSEVGEKVKEETQIVNQGGGFLPDRRCQDGSLPNSTTGLCPDGSQPQVVTPGDTLNKMISDMVRTDQKRAQLADELNEIVDSLGETLWNNVLEKGLSFARDDSTGGEVVQPERFSGCLDDVGVCAEDGKLILDQEYAVQVALASDSAEDEMDYAVLSDDSCGDTFQSCLDNNSTGDQNNDGTVDSVGDLIFTNSPGGSSIDLEPAPGPSWYSIGPHGPGELIFAHWHDNDNDGNGIVETDRRFITGPGSRSFNGRDVDLRYHLFEEVDGNSIDIILEDENGDDESVDYDDYVVRVTFFDPDEVNLTLKDNPYVAEAGTTYEGPGYTLTSATGNTLIDTNTDTDGSNGGTTVTVDAPQTVPSSVGETFDVTFEVSTGGETFTKTRTVVVNNTSGPADLTLDYTPADPVAGIQSELTWEHQNLGGISCTTEAYNEDGEISASDIPSNTGGPGPASDFHFWLKEEPTPPSSEPDYTLDGTSDTETLNGIDPFELDYSVSPPQRIKPTLLIMKCADGGAVEARKCAGSGIAQGGCEDLGP